MLPGLPAECSAWSPATAGLTLELVSADPEGIVARMHRRDVHDGMVILIAIREPRGGGYEIRCELAERLGATANKGVIVTGVKPGSWADDNNVQRGDVILEINRQPVNNVDDFRKIQSGLKSGQDVVLLVRQGQGRSAGTVFLGGTLP